MPRSGAHDHHTLFRWVTRFGVYTASPWAFVLVAAYGAVWVAHESLTYGAVATLAVWTMTLFIQRAQHRDTQAIHAKLDELLRTHGTARNELTQLDEEEPEEIEDFRKKEMRRTS